MNDLELYYERSGDADSDATPPLTALLIHGWASSLRMWDTLVEHWGARVQTWALDLGGFGDSAVTGQDAPLTVEQHVQSVIAFCDQHTLKPAVVFGHSMGGMVVLQLAAVRPDLVPRMVLLAPVVTGRYAFGTSQLLGTPLGGTVLKNSKVFWDVAQSELLKNLIPMALYSNGPAKDRVVNDFRRMNWAAATAWLESTAKHNIGPILHDLPQAALVIVGALDYTVPPDEGRLAAGALPHGKLLELADVFHQAIDEAPERVFPMIDHFLHEKP
jgi:pimeloyl-ACP methyl ester carboxylesterase